VLEIATGQRFGQDICSVVSRMHVSEGDCAFFNQFVDIVKLYVDMFDIGVSNMVFSQTSGSIIVT
jgi:hypothetical protein